jgi:FK506-binding nuclear protein
VNGGPSDPGKTERARKAALVKALMQDEDMDVGEEDEEDLANGINGKLDKGKAKAFDEDDDEDEDDDDDDEDLQEFVLCTLDPKQVCVVLPYPLSSCLRITVAESS